MNKPTLLVLAAGMGSRFGGLKQIEPLGPNGELIIDYSIYDAALAGFERVVFVVKPELLDTFKELVGDRTKRLMEVDYAFQDVSMVPKGCVCPEGRTKPWGTGHAVLCAKDKINGPFGIINADDFYGRDAYIKLGDFLKNKGSSRHMCMVGFPLENTLTENGTVSRGICEISDGMLMSVTERTKIGKAGSSIVFEENSGLTEIPCGSIASMNVWGLDSSVFAEMEQEFSRFINGLGDNNRLNAEFYLPSFVDGLIKAGKADIEVLTATSKWYGVTYRNDKEGVSAALLSMHESGIYPKIK
ncbi:MAG: NTP transferase domain-containing protein [Clostridiaceae bacterium]|nr:NTP transferase domain-containing protein [Clostridiaceae bacterium]